MREEGWKHLYGVIGTTGEITLDSQCRDGKIYPVTYKELSALVSDTSFIDYRGLAKDHALRNLLDHQRVIEGAMHSCSIIPFRFGSLAYTEKEVRQILMQGYSSFKSLLPWVGDRVELELVAMWEREKIFKTLYEEESEIQSLQKTIRTNSEGDVFPEKIILGKLIRQCLLRKKASSREQILSQLREYTESYCDHDVMEDLMILNTAFLLRKEMEEQFDRRVQHLDHTFLGEVSFKVIGPLPLYSFGCIEMEWASSREVHDALALLGLSENASSADVRSAYYGKAKSLHPDKTGEPLNSPSELEKIVKAFHLLDRCYRTYSFLPGGERILLMDVKTNGTNIFQFYAEIS